MTKSVVITGTDTGIGKTFVSTLLLAGFNRLGWTSFGMKPIASGRFKTNNGHCYHDDALQLQKHASLKRDYQLVNPILLEKPVSPNIAASVMNMELSTSFVKQTLVSSIQHEADINVIEGVGGWLVPINETALFADIINELAIPVILVVGIKLGCLNHSLLTYQHMLSKNTNLLGWIANCFPIDTLCIKENISTLQHWIKAPCLGIIPGNCDVLDERVVKRLIDLLYE